MATNKKVTVEDVEKYLKRIYGYKKPEREIKVHRYCPNKGWVDGFDHCDDPECPSCGFVLDLFDEAIKKLATVEFDPGISGSHFEIEITKEIYGDLNNKPVELYTFSNEEE